MQHRDEILSPVVRVLSAIIQLVRTMHRKAGVRVGDYSIASERPFLDKTPVPLGVCIRSGSSDCASKTILSAVLRVLADTFVAFVFRPMRVRFDLLMRFR